MLHKEWIKTIIKINEVYGNLADWALSSKNRLKIDLLENKSSTSL